MVGTKIGQYREYGVYFATEGEVFNAMVNEVRLEDATLAGLKEKIDRQRKMAFKRFDVYHHGEVFTVTSYIGRGRYQCVRHDQHKSREQLYRDDLYLVGVGENDALVRGIKELQRERNKLDKKIDQLEAKLQKVPETHPDESD